MSEALNKNKLAFTCIGNPDLINRLNSLRIGIWSENGTNTNSAVLLAEALGEVIGRLWLHLDAYGPLSEKFVNSANLAASSGGQPMPAAQRWNPPYNYVIAIGCNVPSEAGPGLRIGADGWKAMVGPRAYVSDNENPVGPAAMAAIIGSEIFKNLFADALNGRAKFLPESYMWSAWDFGNGDSPPCQPLDFNNLYVIGVGAVTHGMLWLLERWPLPITGTIHLIDQDKYDESNGQRYIGMRPEDIGASKAQHSANRLKLRHNQLKSVAHELDMNKYFEIERTNCRVPLVVVGVDSAEHRRQLALKLPRRIVNMWTEEEYLGSTRFGFGDGWACPFCVYPEDVISPFDETGLFSQETGLTPSRVRELLFSGEGLTEPDALVIIQKYPSQNVQELIGKPLRSVRGALCATGRINIPGTQDSADVPFAFSSFLAGIGGFVELIHELGQTIMDPGHWQLRVFSYPVPGNWNPRKPNPDCYLCSDEVIKEIMQQKY